MTDRQRKRVKAEIAFGIGFAVIGLVLLPFWVADASAVAPRTGLPLWILAAVLVVSGLSMVVSALVRRDRA